MLSPAARCTAAATSSPSWVLPATAPRVPLGPWGTPSAAVPYATLRAWVRQREGASSAASGHGFARGAQCMPGGLRAGHHQRVQWGPARLQLPRKRAPVPPFPGNRQHRGHENGTMHFLSAWPASHHRPALPAQLLAGKSTLEESGRGGRCVEGCYWQVARAGQGWRGLICSARGPGLHCTQANEPLILRRCPPLERGLSSPTLRHSQLRSLCQAAAAACRRWSAKQWRRRPRRAKGGPPAGGWLRGGGAAASECLECVRALPQE